MVERICISHCHRRHFVSYSQKHRPTVGAMAGCVTEKSLNRVPSKSNDVCSIQRNSIPNAEMKFMQN